MRIAKIIMVIFLGTTSLFSSDLSSGLLIGYSYEKEFKINSIYGCSSIQSCAAQKLHTAWIAPQNDSLILIADFPEIIVPTDSNFWRVNINRSVYNLYTQDNIYALSLDQRIKRIIAPIDSKNGEECDAIESININFVGNKYTSLISSSTGYCKGNAHPGVGNSPYIIELQQLSKPYESLYDISLDFNSGLPKLFGETFFNAFIQRGIDYYNSMEDIDGSKEMVQSSPTALYLARLEGKWIIKGRLEPASSSSLGRYEDFNFLQFSPEIITGYDEMDYSWQELKSLVPNIQDAFMSPARDIIGIYAYGKITFFKIINGQIEKEPLTVVKLTYDGYNFKIVMLQWAVGKHVDRWTAYLKKVKNSWGKYQFNDW